MRAVLERAVPLVEMIWQMEVAKTVPDTPERKAALVLRLNERLKVIPSADIRQFYLGAFVEIVSRELGLKAYVFDDQLRVSASPARRSQKPQHRPARAKAGLTPALKASKLVSARRDQGSAFRDPGALRTAQLAPRHPKARDPIHAAPGARKLKEIELLAILLDAPGILERQYEQLAALPLADSSLDNLRHELLHVAASGIRLETGALEGHLERAGMGWLVERLKPRRLARSAEPDLHRETTEGVDGDVGEFEARWVHAASQLRDMAESDAERRHALERFKSEASEEGWRE
jgi:DNA primase